jgi:alpha-galactosidase
MPARKFATRLAPIRPWNRGKPRINGPSICGVGVKSECFVPIPAVGERPMQFSAEGLPDGLSIDPARGVITGRASGPQDAAVTITAVNARGRASRKVRIVAGDKLALTPPLGWNHWNCWGPRIDAEKVRAAADAMVGSSLAAHGYNYVNIDDGWQGLRGGAFGGMQGNEKFPDMQALCDYVHSLGLRVGIYSTPWTKSYAKYPGGSVGEYPPGEYQSDMVRNGWFFGGKGCQAEDARQWAAWGMDYLKYDWNPIDAPHVEAMRAALRASGRDIVYSLSNSAPFKDAADWARLANCWRTTGDIVDTWESVSGIGFSQDRWTPYGGPGHWNDPDMLVVGRMGWGEIRENQSTHDEQITHITLWSLLAAPMLIGCDLTQLDDFTLRILCNDEVLAVNQDPLGRQGRTLREFRTAGGDGATLRHEVVLVRPLHDGSLAVGLFNRGPQGAEVEVAWAELGLRGARTVRDLWANRTVGRFQGRFSMGVPSHGAQLVRII